MSRARRLFLDYLGIVVGSAFVALALDWFLVPNRIAAGGVSGFATLMHYVFGWPVGMTMLAVNLPLFLISVKVLGVRFGVKTLVGTVSTSILVDTFAPLLSPLTSDPALASIYGGVLAGIGIGITFRYGGSTGGTDMAARLLNHFTSVSVGRSLLIFDGIVIVLAAIAFNAELALYAFSRSLSPAKLSMSFRRALPTPKALSLSPTAPRRSARRLCGSSIGAPLRSKVRAFTPKRTEMSSL